MSHWFLAAIKPTKAEIDQAAKEFVDKDIIINIEHRPEEKGFIFGHKEEFLLYVMFDYGTGLRIKRDGTLDIKVL